eukprot:TRINITY_DN10927_c1_g2_i2.p1 TRINITY_DN10927_c1_g2~~TRINITY_DN10927_c1_g2_i2.p1  ORF type:complete len:151 (-),score=9.59 TRINITY_DN10927_c1_g2_i2:810-1262(-)
MWQRFVGSSAMLSITLSAQAIQFFTSDLKKKNENDTILLAILRRTISFLSKKEENAVTANFYRKLLVQPLNASENYLYNLFPSMAFFTTLSPPKDAYDRWSYACHGLHVRWDHIAFVHLSPKHLHTPTYTFMNCVVSPKHLHKPTYNLMN